MKKIILTSLLFLALSALPVQAVCTTCQNANTNKSATSFGWREQERERIQELREQAVTTRTQARKARAHIKEGLVQDIGTTSLQVEKDGKTYTVNITAETRLVRKYGAKSDLSEFRTGDLVDVWGKYTDTATQDTIDAKVIRNLTIQKRWGVFFGTVESVGDNQFTMTTAKRGTQTVTIDANTKLVNRKMETITLADISAGHKVRVKGVWDNQNNTIRETDQVKDYSIPVRPTVTPKAGITEE